MLKIKKVSLFLGSFILPLFLLTLLWSSLQLSPFGDNNFLVSDLGTQYLPFLSAFKQFFQGDSASLYSFSDALGGSLLSLSAYYLMSPFNILVLLFSVEQLPIAILLIITLKISLMGSTMFYYLNKTYAKISLGTLIFSTAYSLCGFVTVYFLNFMWLDALILLPLLVLGLQHLWDHKKYVLYCMSLFLAIVTNYYLGYMICLFAVFYSFYWYVRTNRSPNKISFFSFVKKGRLFFVSSFLTGISTSFILLPAAEGMLATKKTSFDFISFLPYPKFGLGFFSQLSLGSINFDLRLSHLPTIFSGTLIFLLVIIFFQLKSIDIKQKLYAGCLLGTIFLSFWLELVSTVWHMFQSPAGFPYRNTFIFSFLLIKFAYEAYLKLKEDTTFTWFSPVILSIALIVGLVSVKLFGNSDYILSPYYGLLTLLLIWLYSGILYLNQQPKYKKYNTSLILLFIVCCELTFNFWTSTHSIPFGSQNNFAKTYKNQAQLISDVTTIDPTLYRLKQTVDASTAGYREVHNGYNNAMLYGYAGVSSYSSTLDAMTQDTLTALGLYQKNDRRIAYVDESKVINLLLNVRYQLTPANNLDKKKVVSKENATIYENPEAIGMGLVVPESFCSIALVENNPLSNQEQILQAIHPIDHDYFQALENVTISEDNSYRYSLTAKTTSEGDVYLYLPNTRWKSIDSFKVNGETIQPSIVIVTNQVFYLGNFQKNEDIQLQFDSKTELNFSNLKLETLASDTFSELLAKQKEQAIQLTLTNDGTLNGTVTVQNDNSLLYLAIPFDEKWSIKVDGKSVTQQKVLGNFIGVNLSKGSHKLTMHYQQKSLTHGCIISGSVITIVILYQLLKRGYYYIHRSERN